MISAHHRSGIQIRAPHLAGSATEAAAWMRDHWESMQQWQSQAPKPGVPIKWGSATRVVPDRPGRWRDVEPRLISPSRPPQPHDVLVAQVVQIGRHTGLELDTGRKAKFFPGDILGLVFGHRYATRQFLGDVPPLMDYYHILSQGGVCGRVLSAPPKFSEPTLVRPLGYWSVEADRVANLRDFTLQPVPNEQRPHTILVVGSSMDAGKSTTAASLIRGLCQAGMTVHAGKITGTACVKDLLLMADCGAAQTLDFSQVGYASTSQESRESIEHLCRTMVTHLSAEEPDYLVLEVADGINQRETRFVLDVFTRRGWLDDLVLAVHDALAAPTCIHLLQEGWGWEPTLVSGVATISPLSSHELRALCNVPCFSSNELAEGRALHLLDRNRATRREVAERSV